MYFSKKYYKNNLDINKQKIENKYNNIHPKSLIYLMQYNTSLNDIKYTIIIGNKVNKSNPKGFNYETSNIKKYIMENENEIKYKNGFMLQMLFYSALERFPDSKIIYL